MITLNKNEWSSIHNHTTYSCLDGYNKIVPFIQKAKSLNMKSLGITDHGHLGGIPEFQKECIENNIKPLLGVELYYNPDINTLTKPLEERNKIALEKAIKNGIEIPDKKKTTKKAINELIKPYKPDTKQYHIILLAMNQKGWSNLVKLQSEASRLGTFNGRFCCDDTLLKKYNEGLIMTTACIGSYPASLILKKQFDKALKVIQNWYEIFKDRMYLEIQPIILKQQFFVNYYYYTWSKKYNFNTMATTDCHYTNKEDWDDHDFLLCMGTGKLKKDTNRMKYINDYWLKSYDEMYEGFKIQSENINNIYGEELFNKNLYLGYCKNALENTNKIADRIEDNIKLGADTPQIPNVDTGKYTPEEYFTLESYKQLYRYYKNNPNINLKQYERKLKYELSVINPKGFAKYMLVVKEYIDWCKDNDIPVGPSRGSAGSSLALFLNGITQCIDPIKYHLLFFRFLTPERTALPDVDSDFSYLRRKEVIGHLQEKYGFNNVAHIGTWTVEGVKSGIKDVARVLDIPFNISNAITKKIDDITLKDPNTSFKLIDSFKTSPSERDNKAYKEFKKLENKYPELFRLARNFEGCQRNYGIHASGVLVTPSEITKMIPCRYEDGVCITLYTGTQLEELNYVKFDILGLKTLDILNKAIKSVDKTMTVSDLYNIVNKHLDDKIMFDIIKSKHTDGLFQIESNLFKKLSEEISPDNINDITAMNAIG